MIEPTPSLSDTISSLFSRFQRGTNAAPVVSGGGGGGFAPDLSGDFDQVRSSLDELLGQQGDISTRFAGLGGRVDVLGAGVKSLNDQSTKQINALGQTLAAQSQAQFGQLNQTIGGLGQSFTAGTNALTQSMNAARDQILNSIKQLNPDNDNRGGAF
jgi:hypothetical protein